MDKRPTEIPYIPEDRRRWRPGRSSGFGQPLGTGHGDQQSKVGSSNSNERRMRRPRSGCGCLLFLMIGWLAYSGIGVDWIKALVDEMRPDATKMQTVTDIQVAPGEIVRQIPLSPLDDAPSSAPPVLREVEATGARLPRGNVIGLFRAEDYPSESLNNHEEGTVRVRLSINRIGMARQCIIEQSSGHRRLDEATCRILLERARFEPAVNENGEVVQSSYTTPPIRWQISR